MMDSNDESQFEIIKGKLILPPYFIKIFSEHDGELIFHQFESHASNRRDVAYEANEHINRFRRYGESPKMAIVIDTKEAARNRPSLITVYQNKGAVEERDAKHG